MVIRDFGTGQDENSSFNIPSSVKVHPDEVRGGELGDGNFEEDMRRRLNRGLVPYSSATRQLEPMSHCSSLKSELIWGLEGFLHCLIDSNRSTLF